MSGIPNLRELVFRDTPFANLMNKRIYNVLLIATKYDAFMLEDDGRVDEQIFNEYSVEPSLSAPVYASNDRRGSFERVEKPELRADHLYAKHG